MTSNLKSDRDPFQPGKQISRGNIRRISYQKNGLFPKHFLPEETRKTRSQEIGEHETDSEDCGESGISPPSVER